MTALDTINESATADNLRAFPPLYFVTVAVLLLALIAGIVLICTKESSFRRKARPLIQENQALPRTRIVLALKILSLFVFLLGIALSIMQPLWSYLLPGAESALIDLPTSPPISIGLFFLTLLGSTFVAFLLYTIASSISLQNQQAMLLEYHSRMLQHIYAELTTTDRSSSSSEGTQQTTASKNQMLILNSHSEVLNYHSQMLQYLSQMASTPTKVE